MSEALSSVRSQLQTELGGRTDINSVLDDQYNFALQELCTMWQLKELEKSATFSTSDGVYQYALPGDFHGIIGVYDETNDREVHQRPKHQFEMTDETDTDSGSGGPLHYTIYNQTIIVWGPVPGSTAVTLRIDYWAEHPKLSDDADASLIPFSWERGARLKASAYVHRILKMDEYAVERENAFQTWLAVMEQPKTKEKKSARRSQVLPLRPRRPY